VKFLKTTDFGTKFQREIPLFFGDMKITVPFSKMGHFIFPLKLSFKLGFRPKSNLDS